MEIWNLDPYWDTPLNCSQGRKYYRISLAQSEYCEDTLTGMYVRLGFDRRARYAIFCF